MSMKNTLQLKIKSLSDEIKELAAQILNEKYKAEAVMGNAASLSDIYSEDDFTNLINGYQYTIDELRSVCEHLHEASVQYRFVLDDIKSVETKYSATDTSPAYDGEITSVHARLCNIRDKWNSLYHKDTTDGRKKGFKEANAYFEAWTKEIFDFTEHLGKKYNLLPKEVRIGEDRMVALGLYYRNSGRVSYNRRLIKDPVYALITVIHELCHVRCPNHSPEFWHLYEDICINEGILLNRVLGKRRSFRSINQADIPYRWTPEVDYFTFNEQLTIEKCLAIYGYGERHFPSGC